jgi:hypothetical protein
MVSSDFAQSSRISSVSSEPAVQSATKPYPWIMSPVIDFVCIYGGAFWLLFFTHVLIFGWNPIGENNLQFQAPAGMNFALTKFFVILSVITPNIFSNAHTAATYMRIYATPESREQFKVYGQYLAALPFVLFASALLYPPLQGVYVYLHMMWVFQHYTSQTYGVSLIYCYKRGYNMNVREKQIFKLLLTAIAIFVVTRLLCMREFVTYDLWGIPVPFANLPRPIHYASQVFLGGVFLAFASMVVRKYIRERKMIPMPCLTMLLGVWCLAVASGYGTIILWLWGTPFLHGAQYCMVSLSYYLKERGMPEGMGTNQIARLIMTWPAIRWIGMTVLGGCFIYIGVPDFFEKFGYSFMIIFSVVTACVNFHHFLTDAAIWKLRDPKMREILIS